MRASIELCRRLVAAFPNLRETQHREWFAAFDRAYAAASAEVDADPAATDEEDHRALYEVLSNAPLPPPTPEQAQQLARFRALPRAKQEEVSAAYMHALEGRLERDRAAAAARVRAAIQANKAKGTR